MSSARTTILGTKGSDARGELGTFLGMNFPSTDEIAALVGAGTAVIPTAGLPDEGRIAALERALSVRFPDDYRAFLASSGSLLIQVHEEIWRRPEIGDVGPHWMQTRFELSVFGFCSEVDWMRVEVEAATFRAECDSDLVPVLRFANTSDCICLAPDGTLVAWSGYDVEPLEESFRDAFERLLAEQRKYKEELRAR